MEKTYGKVTEETAFVDYKALDGLVVNESSNTSDSAIAPRRALDSLPGWGGAFTKWWMDAEDYSLNKAQIRRTARRNSTTTKSSSPRTCGKDEKLTETLKVPLALALVGPPTLVFIYHAVCGSFLVLFALLRSSSSFLFSFYQKKITKELEKKRVGEGMAGKKGKHEGK